MASSWSQNKWLLHHKGGTMLLSSLPDLVLRSSYWKCCFLNPGSRKHYSSMEASGAPSTFLPVTLRKWPLSWVQQNLHGRNNECDNDCQTGRQHAQRCLIFQAVQAAQKPSSGCEAGGSGSSCHRTRCLRFPTTTGLDGTHLQHLNAQILFLLTFDCGRKSKILSIF